jgi:hypothetical protein
MSEARLLLALILTVARIAQATCLRITGRNQIERSEIW